MPRRRALLLVTVVLAAGCGSGGSGGDKAVAHVDSMAITQADVDGAVKHFADEASASGKPFPKTGSTAYRTAERQVLALLVYRSELAQEGRKLGVRVTDADVQKRVKSSSSTTEQEGSGTSTFAADTVRAQLFYEGIYRKVTAGAKPSRREAVMRGWLARIKQAYRSKVRYEPGFAPGS